MPLWKPIVTLLMLLTFLLSSVHAQTQDRPGGNAQGQGALNQNNKSQNVSGRGARDVRVVVDISGSMKLNDPDNLRRPAARLIARLLPEDTSAGLWTFGQMVNMLVGHDAVSAQWRESMVERSEQINSVAQRTNLGEAIAEASDPWLAPNQTLDHTHMILLSDGKVDISPDAAANGRERERILQDLVPQLAGDGLTIHTVALSAAADLDLLGAIADMTGGSAHVAGSAEDLSRIFADALGQAVNANEVPLENNRFQVDDGVEEFTALIFSSVSMDDRRLELVSPRDDRLTADEAPANVRWAREPGYDLITITEPAAGKWQVEGVLGEGSRVTVVSNLRLAVEPIPARFEVGDEVIVEASFHEDDTRITDPDFLGLIDVILSLTSEDGRSGSRNLSGSTPPEDGLYRDTIARLNQPGQYRLELVADGGTFSRKYRQTVTLVAPEGTPEAGTDEMPLIMDDSGPESDPEPMPEAGPEEESEGENADRPIDLALVEESAPMDEVVNADADGTPPEAAPAEPTLPERLMAWWPWLAAALGLLVVAGLGIWLMRRRKHDNTESGTETAAQEPPVVDPLPAEPEEKSEDESGAESEPEPPMADLAMDENDIGEPAADSPEPDVDSAELEAGSPERAVGSPDPEVENQEPGADLPQPEVNPEPEVSNPEPEPIDKLDEDASNPFVDIGEPVDDEPEPEEDEPVSRAAGKAATSGDKLESGQGIDEDVPETSRDQDPGLEDFDDSLLDEEDADGEFGLEDFDLSDIDDLPDLDNDEADQKGRTGGGDENESDKDPGKKG